MTASFDERLIDQYLMQGYMIFRGIVPPTLLRDLRREADKARDLAHQEHGKQVQRIQPIRKYSDRIDFKPFQDYADLPALRDAITALLGPGYRHSNTGILGLLIEPSERPWCHGWHRDGVVEVPPEAYDEQVQSKIAEVWHDLTHFNQVNCALYNDSSTWYVPGSHLRQFDLPGEMQTTHKTDLAEAAEGLSNAELERLYLEHCRSFPGAVQVHLGPGDFMVYRNHAWHCGNYIPTQPRATIHDTVCYEVDDGWPDQWKQTKQEAVQRLKQHTAATTKA